MPFESAAFLLFLLVTLTAFWALRRWRPAQKVLLLVASLGFYATYSWHFVGLIVVSILGNHLFAHRIHHFVGFARERWLYIGVVANLLLLGWFKYYGFFVETLNDAFVVMGFGAHLPILQVVLPVGVSFYTFQAIAYLVEVHRESGPKAKNLLDFALFMTFFPQLLIGPICRGRELLPQLEAPAPARIEKLPFAISLILSGLFKRMILASLLFSYGVSDAFHVPENYTALGLWIAMIGYTIQIYCDFSGYVDLMRGCALLFGIEIPDNFNNPYSAASIGDFWRRWHMTFSSWLRDFIYFPLGGSHCSRRRSYLNLFATMFFCGIWHGASWGYIVWGTLHGIALVMYKYGLDERRSRGENVKRPLTPLEWTRGWLWTLAVVSFSRVFFVCSDLGVAGVFLRRMFTPGLEGEGMDFILLPVTLLGFSLHFWGDIIRDRFVRWSEAVPLAGRWVFWLAALYLLLTIRPLGVLPNAYFRF